METNAQLFAAMAVDAMVRRYLAEHDITLRPFSYVLRTYKRALVDWQAEVLLGAVAEPVALYP